MRVTTRIVLLLAASTFAFALVLHFLGRAAARQARVMGTGILHERELALDCALELSGSLQAGFAYDYSYWDDMVRFAARPDPDWAADNIEASAGTFGVHAVWVYGPDGRLAYSYRAEGMDLPAALPVPDSGRAGLFGARQLCHFFAASDRGLLEVRGATIHPTEDAERRTQPRGQLFCVRAWDSTLLNRLGRMSRCSIYVARAETAPAEASLGPGSFCFARPLVGWDGASVAQLHAHTRSPAVAALISSARGSLWSALAFAAAICLLLMLGFAVWVRMPLQRIASSLTAGRADRLGSLGRSRTEFGDIARLVASFFEQRKELEVHRSNLEQLVEQRTVELRIAHEDLLRKERLAALGQVAGSIAHEIHNPLGAIRNAVYYLQRLSDQPLTGKAARHLTIIEREIQHANAVVSSLLEFARGRRCEPADCQVRDIIAGTLARLDVPAGISVELAVAPDLGPVRADPVQMSVVFQNLIANAVDALNGSGTVRIAADRRGDSVRISITDNGPGIGMAHLPRLFEPLFSTKAFGVGLGLPIAKSYVEANGGSIRIDSEVGKGTTVLVSLPAAQPEPAAKS